MFKQGAPLRKSSTSESHVGSRVRRFVLVLWRHSLSWSHWCLYICLCLCLLSLPVVFELEWMRRILFYLQHSHIWVTGAAPGNNICVWSPFFVLFIFKWCSRCSSCDFVTKPVHGKKSSGSLDVEDQPNVRCSGHLRVWFLWYLMRTFRILKMTWLCEITSSKNCFCHFYWRITCVNS